MVLNIIFSVLLWIIGKCLYRVFPQLMRHGIVCCVIKPYAKLEMQLD